MEVLVAIIVVLALVALLYEVADRISVPDPTVLVMDLEEIRMAN